jgi:hypothetical protein
MVVTAVHVAGIGAGESLRAGAVAGFFHDHVGGSLLARLEQPGVVGQPLVGLAVPADAGRGLEFVDVAVDGRAEGDPVERDVGAEEPAGALTVTLRALEYQSGQAAAWTRCSQIFAGGAAITMSLWANRSACSGTMPCGQWMCAERRWMCSMIDMTVPSIRSCNESVRWPGHDSGVIRIAGWCRLACGRVQLPRRPAVPAASGDGSVLAAA